MKNIQLKDTEPVVKLIADYMEKLNTNCTADAVRVLVTKGYESFIKERKTSEIVN